MLRFLTYLNLGNLLYEPETVTFSESKVLMNLVEKIERGVTVLAIAPFVELEKKERDRKLKERLDRLEKKR